MTEDMNGIDAAPALQIIGHLLQAVLIAVEYHHLGTGRHAGQELLVIPDIAVDEDDFVALISGALRRGGQVVVGVGVVGLGFDGLGHIGNGGSDSAVEQHARFKGAYQRHSRAGGSTSLANGMWAFHAMLLVCRLIDFEAGPG